MTTSLSLLKTGQSALIQRINTSDRRHLKLLGLGVNTGVQISVLRNRSGDMVIALGNARVVLGNSITNAIEVQSNEI